jgi:Putative peptidoglycan binding domain
MFNGRRKLMKLFRILAFCLMPGLAITVQTARGQTNGPVTQNNSTGVAVNGSSHANNGHSNAAVSHGIARGPVNFSPRATYAQPARIVGQPAVNFRPSYSPFVRTLNPTLAAMNVRQNPRTYNLQPNPDRPARSEIAQTMPITSDQHVVRTDNSQSIASGFARRQMPQRLETINAESSPGNYSGQQFARNLTKRETMQNAPTWNEQGRNNRFSYWDALRSHRHEWHDRNWWRHHCTNIVFVSGGYYFLDGSYWYPAWGYDPFNNYYDYDGPVYTYGNLLPDQVIANVQEVLQEAGYYGGPITGSLNVETRAALANFQRDYGLLITGAIDQPTIESLGLY